jgi:L-threonylcarbamoyladenylate synthase
MIVQPSPEALERAAVILRGGGLVAFPTETVYGLGANAFDAEAVARIFAVKKRPFASPLIVHVADVATARSLTVEWPRCAEILSRRFWPGPLTLVLRKAEIVPEVVTAGLDSVGIRMPSNPVALALIRAAGVPVAAPSANLFTRVSPTTAQHVQDGLGEMVDLVLDGGPTQVGIESTVASLRRSPPVVLRPGMISQAELETATGVSWDREADRPHLSEPAESPGLHPRHYSPRTPFFILDSGETLPDGRGRVLDLPGNPELYARRLYAQLHEADLEGWEWIAVKAPPANPQWDGILDRLKRAAANHVK